MQNAEEMLPKELTFGKHHVPFMKRKISPREVFECQGLAGGAGQAWEGDSGPGAHPWPASSGKPSGCSATTTARGQHGSSFSGSFSSSLAALGMEALTGFPPPNHGIFWIHLSLGTLKWRSGTHSLQSYYQICYQIWGPFWTH